MDLKDLKTIKLTQKQQNQIAGIVILVGFSVFGYVKYLYQPLVKRVAEKTAILEQKQKELKDAKQMVLKYPEFLRKASTINSKVDFMNKRLPEEFSFADTVRELTKAGTEAGITMIGFSPGKEKKVADYKELQLNVTAKANYEKVGRFLTNIGYIERLITSHEVKMSEDKAAKDENNLDVSLVFKVYASSK